MSRQALAASLIGVVSLGLATTTCDRIDHAGGRTVGRPQSVFEERSARLPDRERARIRKDLQARLTRVAESVSNARVYEKATLELLTFASRQPVDQLSAAHDLLLEALQRDGLAAHRSFAIDYIVRLGQLGSGAEELRRSLGQALVSSPRERSRSDSAPAVYLRGRDRRSFDRYSDSVGGAVLRLAASDLSSRRWLSHAETAADLARLLAAAAVCEREDASKCREKEPWAKVPDCEGTCEGLSAELEEALAGSAPPGMDGSLLEQLAGGRSGIACMRSLAGDALTRQVEQLEDYMECREAEFEADRRSRNGSWVASGGYGYKPDLDAQGRSWGGTWKMPDGNGGTIELSHQRAVNQATGDIVDFYDETHTDAQGTQTYHSNETVSSTNNGDGSYTVDITSDETKTTSQGVTQTHTVSSHTHTNSPGGDISSQGGASVTTVTHTDSDGNVTTSTTVTVDYEDGSSESWTTTTDADGKVTEKHEKKDAPEGGSSGTATTQPVGHEGSDPCGRILDPSVENALPVDPLAPLIYPDPESPGGSVPAAACLPTGRSSPARKCVSAYLCLEGQTVDENCRCVNPGGIGLPPARQAGRCALITCLDGQCDPGTGMCRTGDGDFDPPASGPLPDPVVFGSGLGGLPSVPGGPALSGAGFERLRRDLDRVRVSGRQP